MDERSRGAGRGTLHPLLKMAAMGGVDSAIRLHIGRGADLNGVDERGRSALMLAAQKGHARACRLLLDAGAEPDILDAEGLDALAHAQPGRHADVVLALLEHRARTRPPVGWVVADSAPPLGAIYEAKYELDASMWEAEPEPLVPERDLLPVLASAEIQAAISTHRPIDRDQTWDDVDVQLPKARAKAGAAPELDGETLASWRDLIRLGLTLGELPTSYVLAAAIQQAIPTDDAEWLLRETLSEFGVCLDGFEPWIAGAFDGLLGGEDQDEDPDIEARADTAIDYLVALRRERDRVYWSCLTAAQAQPRLRRPDEAVLGAEIEAAVEAVLEALALAPFLREALNTSLRDRASTAEGGDEDGKDDGAEEERDVASVRAAALLCQLGRARGVATAAGRPFSVTGEQLRELGAARAPVRRLALVLHRRGGNDDAVRRYLDGADRWHRAWSSLVLANLRLSVQLVRKSWKNGAATTDLIQEANTGIMRAVEKFDFRRGTGFGTYAAWWVRARVERHASCSTLVRTPTLVAEARRKAIQAQRRLEVAGVEFNSADVAREAGVERTVMNRALALGSEFFPIPRLPGEEDDGVEDLDPDECTPEGLAVDSELRQRLHHDLGALGPRQSFVLRLRFGFEDGDDHTLSEIGQKVGLSRERIRQIERDALNHLRRLAGVREVVPTEVRKAVDDD